ncbi:filamentous hemagglutinin N-terminal domain-containing protein [Pseudomonas sp. MWU12-2345]|uniref:two-partner secretion domain-containing protein n=1 Tax=Pseudomonas sp. MWU12-2345 TaxID=2928689 RepID=UPI00200F6F45|nr:filamentous hemagglutinin N-terminal domain-containing protein [Pseudomonas sp. MWU12-2345]
MDVRQLVFLARQPSAALKNREHFWGLPKRGLAFILANAMFWQPLLAQADGIVVNAPGTTLGQAGNGVPIVNIAAPNAQGLSHNQFSDYNVGANGVILNNATNRTQSTQLGGIILGNPNFNGAAANVILNEVNGGSPSQLRGYTEVAGQSAHVIVANPYGISCNGCGFINTPQATLTTGKAVITNGQVTGYQVDQGSVSIDGAGLNASNIDQFEIITRAATINAQINAKQLTVIAGRNDVDAQTLKATARADDGSTKPQVAIDSSVLGGMYAGAIKLVGTEAGVGVKLAGNLAASGGDIQLDANGQLSLAQATASGAVNVKAASLDAQGPVYAGSSLNVQTTGDLNSQNNLAARDSITLNSGGQLSNHGIIEAGVNADNSRNTTGDVSVTAQNIVNNGQSVIASRDLSVTATQTLGNQGGTLSGQRQTTVTAGTLDNQNKGRVLSAGQLNLTVDTALNGLGGLINSSTALTATLGHLVNSNGQLSTDGTLNLTVDNLENGAGTISSQGDLSGTVQTLGNQAGVLVSQGNLSLSGNSLDNTHAGLIGGVKGTTLTVGQIDNRGGELSSTQAVTLVGQQLNNDDNGKVLADTDLHVSVAAVTNRNGGQLLGKAGTTTLNGSSLDNSGGTLSGQSAVVVTLDGALSNLKGLIASDGSLSLNVGSLDNSGGNLSSGTALTVTSNGAVVNQGGTIATDTTLGLTSASLDNSQSGVLTGKGATRVTTGTFDNSHGGRLSSNDTLNLNAGQVTNQDGGSIASSHALTASVSGLDQQGGQLFSTSALTLDLNHGQLNNQNGYINAPLLVLNNLKGVNNQGGEISSAQAYTFAAESLSNDNGKLLSNQALTLRIDQALSNIKGMISAASVDAQAGSLDNTGGTLTSRADLGLTVGGQLTNQNQGLINATSGLTISSAGINNQGGSLLGSAIALDFGAATGDLNNAAGQITTAGNLTINHLRDLNNQGGTLSSTQSLNLTARTLDNSNGGQLISNNLLSLTATDLINQNGGLLSGWQGVTLTGSSVDNRNSGTVSSRSGNVGVTLSGALLNSNAGALASQQTLTVNAASIDNSNKGILSSGAGQSLTVSGLLNNAQGGLIDSGATLALNTMALTSSGTINVQQALTFTGTDFDNSNGTLSGGAAVTLDLLGTLTNTNGKLSAVGPLLVQRSTQVKNQGGQLSSQGLLTLLTGGLDNSNSGTIGSGDKLLVTSTGTVQNGNGGLIASRNADLQLSAASLGNGKGSLQGMGSVNLDVSGDIDNQSGKVIAQNGDLTLNAANIDSRGGLLSSIAGALQARVVGVLKNGYDLNNNGQGGQIQAQRLDLQAWGGIDNYGGHLTAQTGDALIATGAGDFDNRNGGVYAKGLVQVTGHNFDNSGDSDGQIGGNQISLNLAGALNNRLGIIESGSTLAITAASLDNQTGQLRALGGSGKTEFQIGGLFDNSNGKLETANSDLTLGVGSFLNQGGSVLHTGTGTFDTATANITNAGGSFVTRGGLTLTADNWTNSSVIQAGRLTLNVNTLNQTAGGQLLASSSLIGNGGNWNNDGLIASDGTASLNLSGSYGGNGRYTSLSTLGLSAAQVNLSSSASIAGGGDTTISVAGPLNSYGRITSAGGMSVSAGSINNYGTLGSNGNLLLSAPNLLNQNSLIFSGGDMALRTDVFTNRYADVYSFGNLSIAKDDSNGLSSSINNISSTMESGGDLSLSASHIENRKDVFQATGGLVSGYIGVQCYYCSDIDHNFLSSASDGYLVWVENYKSQIAQDSAASSITAGRNFTAVGGDLINQESTLSAGNNLTLNLQNFTNQGASVGDYIVRRSYVAPPSQGKYAMDPWMTIMAYNAANDPFYDSGALGYVGGSDPTFSRPNMHFWNSSGVESIIQVMPHPGGKNGDTFIRFGTLNVEPHEDLWVDFARPSYNSGVRTEAPALIQYAMPFDTTTTGSSDSVNAVVQAGGAVNISATQNLTNSVVRQGVVLSSDASRVGSTQVGSDVVALININRQLSPDLAQQQVNPLTLPGFSLPSGQNGLFRLSGQGAVTTSTAPAWSVGGSIINATQRQSVPAGLAAPAQITVADSPQSLARVQGLPDASARTNPQKYLIETNPVLTDLKQFMSSDYLLSNLGYNPDESAKRLGDGLYEQRLIDQAVTARTGQRFIDGQTSDDAEFKYLMDNAISSQKQLNLSYGVGLTSEQVAALTHDIVWMEKQVVDGQEVMVPVLYLAQANNRLAPNGALIEGNDVNLIAGQDLSNSGTLHANNTLSAAAGNDLVNSGLTQAYARLDMLAGNNLTNMAGGIIAGRDVNLTAVQGDVINERSVSTFSGTSGADSFRTDVVDNAARIEVANNLSISAGRDVNNVGSVLQSGADTAIKAGRDINLLSTTASNNGTQDQLRNGTVSQYAGSVDSGGSLTLNAGRDITAVASQIDAKRDVSMAAAENLTLASAANENHFYSEYNDRTHQTDHVAQVATSVNAGGDIRLSAGQDMALVSSKVNAGNDAYLVAGGKLDVLAAQNTDHTLYDKNESGGWLGGSSTRHDEVTQVTNIGSQITAGGNLGSISGGDQLYQAAKLTSGKDLTLQSGGDITFEGVKDLHKEDHAKSNNGMAWTSMSGSGSTDETLKQTEMTAKGQVVIKAVDGLHIDVKQVNEQTVSQAIDAMVQADPQLAWLKDAEKRGDVDWRQIKELHDSYSYSHSGLGEGAMLAIIIIVTVLTAGAASSAVGTMASAEAGSGTAMAAATTADAVAAGAEYTAAGWANVALSAAMTSMASNAAVSFINNGGNIGATFNDVTSSSSLKGYALAGISAGVGNLVPYNPAILSTETVEKAALTSVVNSVAKTAIEGGSLKDNLTSSLAGAAISVGGATLANDIGGTSFSNGSLSKVGLHALLGGVLSVAQGGDFKTGALAAGADEASVQALANLVMPDPATANIVTTLEGKQRLVALSGLVGILAAVVTGGDPAVAASVAENATQYNYLLHNNQQTWIKAQGGDDIAQARLTAAACAATHCAAEFPVGSAAYNFYSGLETLGNSDSYAVERQQVSDSGLFNYSLGNQSVDSFTQFDNTYQVGTRAGGLLQIGGAFGLAGAGAATSELGIGVPLVVVAADQGAAGLGTLINGTQVPTFGAQLLSSQMNITVGQAEMLYGLATMAGAARAANLSSQLGDDLVAANSTNAGAKGPATDLASGETKVVGDGAPAANDASFTVPKGYTQNLDGTVTGPGGGIYKATGTLDANGNQIYLSGNGNYYTLTADSSTRIVSPNPPAGIGATGQIGENALKELGGRSQVSFQTSQGVRVVDQLDPSNIANEAKVGYTTLDATTALQISKDAELLNTEAVDGVTWNFFTSPVTGQGGPSTALLKALTDAGIKVLVH